MFVAVFLGLQEDKNDKENILNSIMWKRQKI